MKVASLFDKFIGIMGFGDEDDDDELIAEETEATYKGRRDRQARTDSRDNLVRDYAQDEYIREVPIRESSTKRKAANVVSIHTQKQVRVIVVEPSNFEETQGIAEHLKARKSVILNLENTDINLSQRIVDFICGTTYALGGNMQKVGNGIFLFVPNNVDISANLNYKNDDNFLWPKSNN